MNVLHCIIFYFQYSTTTFPRKLSVISQEMPLFPSVDPSVDLPVDLPVELSVIPYVDPSAHPSVNLPANLPASSQSVHPFFL